MSMKLTFEAHDIYQLTIELRAAANLLMPMDAPDEEETSPEPKGEPETKPAPKKRGRKPKAEKTPEPEDDTGAPDTTPDAPEEVAVDHEKDYAAASALLMSLYGDGHQSEVKAILAEYGVKKFGEIAKDHGPALLEKAKSLQAEKSA